MVVSGNTERIFDIIVNTEPCGERRDIPSYQRGCGRRNLHRQPSSNGSVAPCVSRICQICIAIACQRCQGDYQERRDKRGNRFNRSKLAPWLRTSGALFSLWPTYRLAWPTGSQLGADHAAGL